MDTKKQLKLEVSQAEFGHIEDVVAQTTARFMTDLPQLIKTRLEGAVAKILGFENRWGNEWNVDHCNGRSTVMGEYIAAQAREAAGKAVNDVATAAIKELTKNDKLHDAIKKEFANIFEQELRRQLYDYAKTTVSEMLKKATETHSIEIESLERFPTRKEMSHPDFGKKPMEKLVAEVILKSGKPLKE